MEIKGEEDKFTSLIGMFCSKGYLSLVTSWLLLEEGLADVQRLPNLHLNWAKEKLQSLNLEM